MRFAQMGLYAVLVVLGSGCGEQTAPDVLDAARADTSATSLPCDETEQTAVALDVPGPGRPSPEEAVAPFAGALTLVAQERDGGTAVLGLRADDTVFRVFDVTEREDGWWPDGYRECSGSRWLGQFSAPGSPFRLVASTSCLAAIKPGWAPLVGVALLPRRSGMTAVRRHYGLQSPSTKPAAGAPLSR